MAFDYRSRKKTFENKWEKTKAWYIACGMDEASISKMKEFDIALFNQTRSIENHECELNEATFPDEGKEDDVLGGDDWIETLENAAAAAILKRQSKFNRAILTMYIEYEMSQEKIAELLKIDQSNISRRINQMLELLAPVYSNNCNE